MNVIKAAMNCQVDHIMAVGLLIVAALLAFSATGFAAGQGTDGHTVAEAAAMEGARELPQNPAGAVTRATEWAMNQGVQAGQIKSVQVRTTTHPNDTLYVEIQGEQRWMLGKLLGKVTHPAGASASARVSSLTSVHNLMPWGLLQGDSACLDANGKAIVSAVCAVKVGAGGSIQGWYGALDYDGKGGGAAEYESNIVDGTTDRKYCIANDPAAECRSTFSVIDTLAGNQVGQTDRGIDERTSAAPCDADANGKDDFYEVFATYPGSTPGYKVLCPNSPRLITLPIVSYESTPVKAVTVRGWVLAYLNGYACAPDPIGSEAQAAAQGRDRQNPTPTTATNSTTSSAHAYISVHASPSPPPPEGCRQGKGHWQVFINIVDAAYSQTSGFLAGNSPASRASVRRLVK